MNGSRIDLVRERIDAKLKLACTAPLAEALGLWLGVIQGEPAQSERSVLQQYGDVALDGITSALTGSLDTRASFTEGLAWLQQRRFFVPNKPKGLEDDPLALLCIAIGIHASPQLAAPPRQWFVGFVDQAIRTGTDARQSEILALCRALAADDSNSWANVTPLLEVAIADRLKRSLAHERYEAALVKVMSLEELEAEWAILHASALRAVFASQAGLVLDVVQPTVAQVAALLRRVPAALKRWPWEDKPKTGGKRSVAQRWDLQNEYHVQSLLWTILSPLFSDLEDEESLPSVGHKHPRSDLALPRLHMVIEVKFLREATQAARAKVVEEVAADSALYLAENSPYTAVLVFIWDESGSSHHHDEFNALRKLRGIADVVVVSRPGSWKQSGSQKS